MSKILRGAGWTVCCLILAVEVVLILRWSTAWWVSALTVVIAGLIVVGLICTVLDDRRRCRGASTETREVE